MALFNMPMATLTDLDPPVIEGTTVGTSTEIYENIALDSFIARVQTDSPVASFAITSGNTAGAFKIAANGDITTENAINYEATTSFTLEIVATDHVGRDSQPFTFTVNVLDLDENPPVVTLDTSATNLTQINEFVTTDTRIATFNVVDNDTGGAVATTGIAALTRQYIAYVTIGGIRTDTALSLAPTADVTLFGDPSRQNFFTVWNYISTTNGQVEIWAREKVALAGGVDVNTDITLTVGVADQAGNYGYANYTITVNDFPDPSIFQPVQLRTPDNTFRIQENTPLAEGQGFLSQYTATGTVPVEFSVSGPDADKVTISSDGQLTLTSPLDYEAQTSHTFTVRATNYLYGSDGEIDQTYFDEEECTLTVINDPTDDPLNVEIGSNMDGVMHETRIRSAGSPLGAISGRLFTACTYSGSGDAFSRSVFCEIDPTTGDLTVITQLPTADVSGIDSHMTTRGSLLWARWIGYGTANSGFITLNRNGSFSLRAMPYDQTIDRDDQTNGRFWDGGRFLDPEDQNFWGYYTADNTWMNIDTQGRKVGSLRRGSNYGSARERRPSGEGIAVGPYFYTPSFDPDNNRSQLSCYIRPTAQTLSDGTAFDFVGHARVRFPFSTDNGSIRGVAVIGTTLYLTASSTNSRTRLASFNLPNPDDPLATLTSV